MRLAVIGANKPSESFYKQAKNLGHYIIGIAWAEGAVCKKYCDKFYPISFADKEEVLRVCREEKIDGITSFSLESALPTVNYVAQNLGLVSNTVESLDFTKSKFAQRETFERNGIPVPRYYKVYEESELDSLELNYPIIVKPIDSGGSQGVNKLESNKSLVDAFRVAADYSRTNGVIIEEFIDGREFSVEYISCNGKHYFLQVTDKVTSEAPHFIEMQHHQPANISDEIIERIKDMVEKALTALHIENSPSHTEIKLNSRGELYIIEVGARMGGDFITSDLVRLSTGYDMVKGAIDLACGKFIEPKIVESNYSGVYFYSDLAPHIGEIILNKNTIPEIVDSEYIAGDLPKAKSNADRNGYLIYKSEKGKLIL